MILKVPYVIAMIGQEVWRQEVWPGLGARCKKPSALQDPTPGSWGLAVSWTAAGTPSTGMQWGE